MNETALKNEVIAELQSELGKTFSEKQIEQITPLCLAIARAVINHITSNAEVATNVTTTVAAPIPVQTVPATGTGATTATGVGSQTGAPGTVS